MKKYFTHATDRDFFSKLKLESYTDFIDLKGEIVSNPGKRPVQRIILKDHGTHKIFFLKQTSRFSLTSLLKRVRKGIGLHGDAYIEQAQIKRYEDAGIPVMRVSAWGETKKFGWPCSDFLLAAEIEGERLDRFIQQCSAKEKEEVFLRYGELIARMHQNGISEVTRIQDIICTPGENIKLTVIDREHGLPIAKKLSDSDRVQRLARTYLKNLSALNAKKPMIKELQFLLNGYATHLAQPLQTLELQVKQEVKDLIAKKDKLKTHQWILSSPDF